MLAVLDRDTVARIEVSTNGLTTAERLGVGSTFAELRAAYGQPCAEAVDGRMVVRFQNAPGVSFSLGTPISEDIRAVRSSPDDAIPADAEVTRWWIHGAAIRCPL